MKTTMIVIALTGLLLLGGVMFYSTDRTRLAATSGSAAADTSAPIEQAAPAESAPAVSKAPVRPEPREVEVSRAPAPAPAPLAGIGSAPSLPFQQALNTLVSPEASFAQRQGAMQQIKNSGHLDQLITELERRSTSDTTVAAYPAALGQAYLQKAGTVEDLTQQGILGLKADQTFDAALNIDPSNWDAAFWKVAAMSYWPPELGKGPEVVQRLVDLVRFQEGQALQPQFVQTYLLLGEQYQKQGYPDYAKEIWQRGVVLFPNDARLAEKLDPTRKEEMAAH